MHPGLVVITAQKSDTKLVNRLLLHIRDWKYGEEGSWDSFRIARTIDDVSDLERPEADSPPIQDFPENQWEGRALDEVEKLMILKGGKKEGRTVLYLLLDDQGVRDSTIIVAERAHEDEPGKRGSSYLDEFNKVRVPWQEAYIMWYNLDISNMDFAGFCHKERGYTSPDRWWEYKPPTLFYRSIVGRRNTTIKELAKLDLA